MNFINQSVKVSGMFIMHILKISKIDSWIMFPRPKNTSWFHGMIKHYESLVIQHNKSWFDVPKK